MSIVITSEGMDVALGRMQDVLEALGGKGAGIAIARALNRSIQAAGTRATRIAKTAYTAQYDELRANLEIRRANRSNLEGALNITGRPGMSLIHFLPDPDVPQPPAARPAAGVSVQIKKKGARHPATSNVAGEARASSSVSPRAAMACSCVMGNSWKCSTVHRLCRRCRRQTPRNRSWPELKKFSRSVCNMRWM